MKPRLFFILFFAGFAGIVSFLFVDLAAMIALVPVQPGTEVPVITPALKVLSLIQPAVLLAVAVLIGVALAPRVGLSSPFAEALAAGRPAFPALRPQLMPGVVGALIGSAAILLTGAASKPLIAPETAERMGKFGEYVPMVTRLLYGGVTEELLMRWGLMTLLAWAVWRVFQRGLPKPGTIPFVAAILISSLLFGLGHLPIAKLLVPDATAAVIAFVITANSAFGIVAGYLYWKYGLESAMLTHILGHIILAAATYAGAYF